jgi:REP element-mobilizing transposase RayT
MQQRPYRRSIRLPDWDYSAPGAYFVTLCTFRRELLFADELLHSTAANAWLAIVGQPHARRVVLDEWVVMPNHVHGLIILTADGYMPPQNGRARQGTLGTIVGNYKGRVTHQVKALLRASGSDMRVWQRGYWDRIVRNEQELNAIREYIRLNPARWDADPDNLDALLERMNYRDVK